MIENLRDSFSLLIYSIQIIQRSLSVNLVDCMWDLFYQWPLSIYSLRSEGKFRPFIITNELWNIYLQEDKLKKNHTSKKKIYKENFDWNSLIKMCMILG